MRSILMLLLLMPLTACSSGPRQPVPFDAANEPCRFCRMVGSNGRFAAQIVGQQSEPLFFDDIGCLVNYLRRGPQPADAVAYVVDHRTGEWIHLARAQYSRNDAITTPMGSHLLAHASAESRGADADARGGTAVSLADVFAGVSVPGGSQ